MTNRQPQMVERVVRQLRIDETFVEPEWAEHVDIPLLELCFASRMPQAPVVLMPELRFRTLLQKLAECFPRVGKVMIVDEANSRFESLRRSVPKTELNLYFSAQEVSALNYSNDIFHFVLTQVGLSTLLRLDIVLSAYRRVMRPDGHLVMSAPLVGSFPVFFDILDECLLKLYPGERAEIMSEIVESMEVSSIERRIGESGFEVEGRDTAIFELTFPNVEPLLFSTLVESHYLGVCLGLRRPDVDTRALLTLVVRSFHHYFQGESLRVPMKIALISASK